MYKAERCFMSKDERENDIIILEVTHPDKYRILDKFGSRVFGDTKEKINAVLNGKYFKLPFGFRLIKTK